MGHSMRPVRRRDNGAQPASRGHRREHAEMIIKSGQIPPRETVYQLAGRASVDDRTAREFLAGTGSPKRGMVLERLTAACAELGIVLEIDTGAPSISETKKARKKGGAK